MLFAYLILVQVDEILKFRAKMHCVVKQSFHLFLKFFLYPSIGVSRFLSLTSLSQIPPTALASSDAMTRSAFRLISYFSVFLWIFAIVISMLLCFPLYRPTAVAPSVVTLISEGCLYFSEAKTRNEGR